MGCACGFLGWGMPDAAPGAATDAAVESDEERNRRFTLLLDRLDLTNQGGTVFEVSLAGLGDGIGANRIGLSETILLKIRWVPPGLPPPGNFAGSWPWG